MQCIQCRGSYTDVMLLINDIPSNVPLMFLWIIRHCAAPQQITDNDHRHFLPRRYKVVVMRLGGPILPLTSIGWRPARPCTSILELSEIRQTNQYSSCIYCILEKFL